MTTTTFGEQQQQLTQSLNPFLLSTLILSPGFFCATFYHFFVHDLKGPIGRVLRAYTPLQGLLNIEDDNAYAAVMIVGFMQVMGILQLPRFIGPQFTPFGADILNPWKDSSSWEVGKQDSAYSKKKRNRGRRGKKKVA